MFCLFVRVVARGVQGRSVGHVRNVRNVGILTNRVANFTEKLSYTAYLTLVL